MDNLENLNAEKIEDAIEDTNSLDNSVNDISNSNIPIIKRIFKKCKFWIIFAIIMTILYGAFTVGKKIYMEHREKLSSSHVYVCDNPEHKSDFEQWMHDELELDWVPTYIVIKDQSIIGKFPGDIDKEEFSSKMALCVAYDMKAVALPNYEISNLDGERKNLYDIFSGNDTYILEVHWVDCEDCQHQDDNYTKAIYSKYGTSNFYRYYIKSDKEKVQEKYSD